MEACEPLIEGTELPSIRVDNEAGAAIAVQHLVKLGHRKIGHIRGPADNVLTHAAARRFKRALAEHGLKERPEWLFAGNFLIEAGVEAARKWLALKEPPTAVTTSSDVMACGFIAELNRAGVLTPRDVSVVGFDDIDIAAQFIPSLTTIRQPRLEIGEYAAGVLLGLIRNPDQAVDTTPKMLPAELIVRGSTAAPKA